MIRRALIGAGIVVGLALLYYAIQLARLGWFLYATPTG